jgi:hypothetical protein
VPPRGFLLSPASCRGARAALLLSARARSPLAQRLRTPPGVPLGEVFSFLSQLYFRGKLVYATAFARPPRPGSPATGDGVLVITPSHGLVSSKRPVTDGTLCEYAAVDLHAGNPLYRDALEAGARRVADALGSGDVVLLGSIATPKYVEILASVFGERLLFPRDFVGRGDMSRGSMMLRAASAGQELDYVPAIGTDRHGPRADRVGQNDGVERDRRSGRAGRSQRAGRAGRERS